MVDLTCDNPDCDNEFSRPPSTMRKYKRHFCTPQCHWRTLALDRIVQAKAERITA